MIDAPATDSSSGGIQVLRRATAILRAVSDRQGELRLVDLSPLMDLPKTTVHRIVSALGEDQLLRIDASGHIWLGPALVSLGRVAAADLAGIVRPVLETLAEHTGETVDLSVLDGSSVRFIDQIPSRHRLRAVSTVGAAFPLHCSANGKALLAALPPEQVTGLLPRRLERFTAHTIVDRRVLETELSDVRRTGIAEDREEHTIGIRALGVAISDGRGPVAALSIPVPADRYRQVRTELFDALASAGTDAHALLAG